jgi:hypothetical protein
MGAVSENRKMAVSVKVLQRMSDATRGHGRVNSANFCAKNPPRAEPSRWTFSLKNNTFVEFAQFSQKIIIRQNTGWDTFWTICGKSTGQFLPQKHLLTRDTPMEFISISTLAL